MKKRIISLLMIILLFGSFLSCGEKAITKDNIVGTWKSSYHDTQEGIVEIEPGHSIIMSIFEEGLAEHFSELTKDTIFLDWVIEEPNTVVMTNKSTGDILRYSFTDDTLTSDKNLPGTGKEFTVVFERTQPISERILGMWGMVKIEEISGTIIDATSEDGSMLFTETMLFLTLSGPPSEYDYEVEDPETINAYYLGIFMIQIKTEGETLVLTSDKGDRFIFQKLSK